MAVVLYTVAFVVCLLVGLACLGVLVAGLAKKGYWLLMAAVLVAGVGCWAAFLARSRAQQVDICAQEMSKIGAAIELYGQADACQYPPSMEYLLPFYFDNLPRCPLDKAGDGATCFEKGYEHSDGFFTVCCRGHNHAGLGGTSQDYPQYSSSQGLVLHP